MLSLSKRIRKSMDDAEDGLAISWPIDKWADEVAQLEAELRQAAENAFESDVIQTGMLQIELEANTWIGAEQYKEDWIETWLCGLRVEVDGG